MNLNDIDQGIAPGVDVDALDLKTADRGDTVPAPAPAVAEPAPAHEPAEVPGEGGEGGGEGAGEGGEQAADAQPREENGRFAKKDDGGKEARIPKTRFDEAVGKEREARESAERRAAELERQLQERERQGVRTAKIEEIEAQIETLERQHATLLLDGDAEKAAAVMKQIRQAERQVARAEAEASVAQRTTQILEQERVDSTIARLEADYSAFNPESDSYDPDLVELVLSKQRTLMQSEGLSQSKALEKAGRDVAERFLKKAEEPEPRKGLGKAGEGEGDRKAAAVKAALAVSKAQPPAMKDVGLDSDKAGQSSLPDVTKMTMEEFSALPASTLARLRGDMA